MWCRSTILLFICVLLGRFSSVAQAIEEASFTRYTKLQGLSHNYISAIVQDSTGYLWVATKKGLNRFDGRSFTSFYRNSSQARIPDNLVESLRLAKQHLLVGTTLGGAFIINTQTLESRQLEIPVDSAVTFWVNHGVDALIDTMGHVVISTKTGLYVLMADGKVLARYDYFKTSDAGRKELLFGNWLLPLNNGSILQHNSRLFSSYIPASNKIIEIAGPEEDISNLPSFAHGKPAVILPGKYNRLFILNTLENSLDVYDLTNGNITHNKVPFSLNTETDNISRIYYYNDSTIALTGKISGFYLFRQQAAGDTWQTDGNKHFSGVFCTVLFRDHDGRLWVGTSDGLYKENLSNTFFDSIDLSKQEPELINHEIKALIIKKSKIFAGLRQDGGVIVLNQASGKIIRRIQFDRLGPNCSDIYYLFDYHPDTVWVCSAGGILWLNTSNYATGRVAVPADLSWINQSPVYCMMRDHEDNIWMSFAIVNSLVSFDPRNGKFNWISPAENPLLKTTKCWSMAEDRNGNIWIAGDGLCRWNRSRHMIDTLIPYPTVTTALRNYMYILGLDSGNNLWLSSFDNEIIQFNCDENKMYLRKEENNLLDGNTVMATPIINDNIWLGTDNGISAFNIRNFSIKQFTYADGLPTVVITSTGNGSCYDKVVDRFYFGAKHHLISFIPDIHISSKLIPQLFIEKMRAGDSYVMPGKAAISFSHLQNDLQVSFNAIDFSNPEDVRFAVRLLPAKDSAWKDLGPATTAQFINLAPGHYEAQVKLYSVNNRWPDQVKEIAFTINPPFWATWWFLSILGFLLLALVVVIYRIRIHSIREKAYIDKQLTEFEMKALHAQMNPHFIFNALNSIKEMILANEQANASRYLSKFARLIRMSLDHSKQTFINLRQAIDHLQAYLEMEQLRFPDFAYYIDVDENILVDEIYFVPMLMQPLVENAIWHGLKPKQGLKQVNIRFYLKGNLMICEIEDNGIGINKASEIRSKNARTHRSMGIENIRQRISVLNEKYNISCSLTIADKSESRAERHGTIATLIMPGDYPLSENNNY